MRTLKNLFFRFILLVLLLNQLGCWSDKKPVADKDKVVIESVARSFLEALAKRDIATASLVSDEQALRAMVALDVMQIQQFEIEKILRDEYGVEVFVRINKSIQSILYCRVDGNSWMVYNVKSDHEIEEMVRQQ